MKYSKKIKKEENMEKRVKDLKLQVSELKKENVLLNRKLNEERKVKVNVLNENLKLRERVSCSL